MQKALKALEKARKTWYNISGDENEVQLQRTGSGNHKGSPKSQQGQTGGKTVKTGTSMAAPHISALCAMMHLIHPGLSSGQVERRLQQASLGTNSIVVPDSVLMIPAARGFSLSSIIMGVYGSLIFSSQALPHTACEAIAYKSSDEGVVVFEGGLLHTVGKGVATITATCIGLDESMFTVMVDDYPDSSIILPNSLETIEDEAFYGDSSLCTISIPSTVSSVGNFAFECCDNLGCIQIPDTVTIIRENTFSNAVIICSDGSSIQSYAVERGLQHILQEWNTLKGAKSVYEALQAKNHAFTNVQTQQRIKATSLGSKS